MADISVILAHPDKGSFNHAIAGAAMYTLRSNRHSVNFSGLKQDAHDQFLNFLHAGRNDVDWGNSEER